MKFKVVKETKPRLSTFGKYKAVAVHHQTIGKEELIAEVAEYAHTSEGTVIAVLGSMADVVNRHLRNGDKVRLRDLGMLKLEIESDVVEEAAKFRAKKHIRGVRLHFLPESFKGSPELYKDIKYERENSR